MASEITPALHLCGASRVIVHVSMEYGSTAWGGIATAVRLLCAAAASVGERSLILTPGDTDYETELEPLVTHRTFATPLASAHLYEAADRIALARSASQRMAAYLAENVRTARAIVIHNEELIGVTSGGTSAPSVLYCHGLHAQEHPDRSELLDMQRRALRRANVVAVATLEQGLEVARHVPGLRVELLPLPLSLLPRGSSPRTPTATATLLCAGRAVPQKGFDIIIAAISLLPAKLAPTLHIYFGHGDPAYERSCRSMAAASSVVRFHPWGGHDQLLRVMQTTWALLVPSRFEPLGLIAAEAMAVGTRVVGSDTGGLGPLVAAGGGLVVPANGRSTEQAARLWASAIESVALAGPGENGDGRRALASFSPEATMRALQALLGGA